MLIRQAQPRGGEASNPPTPNLRDAGFGDTPYSFSTRVSRSATALTTFTRAYHL